MSARWWTFLALSLAAPLMGCVEEREITLEIRPPRDAAGGPDIPDAVRSFELRVYRVGEDERCPDLDRLAEARPFGALGHAQRFDVETGVGDVVGELPFGSYAFVALGRDEGCAVHLSGCLIRNVAASTTEVSIPVDRVEPPFEGCGTCRRCDPRGCLPVEIVCP